MNIQTIDGEHMGRQRPYWDIQGSPFAVSRYYGPVLDQVGGLAALGIANGLIRETEDRLNSNFRGRLNDSIFDLLFFLDEHQPLRM